MTGSLEDLEKEFIHDEDAEPGDIRSLVTRIMMFCKIDKSGYVVVSDKKLSIQDKILLILSARYLAHKLQVKLGKEGKINSEVTTTELTDMIRANPKTISGRLSELTKGSKVKSPKIATYKIAPHAIEQILVILEEGKNAGR